MKAGFVSGQATESIVAKAILGSSELGTYLEPKQVVNYVEAHDNYNLHDLLAELHPDDDELTRTKRIELATAMNLLLQGMSFMELGQEFSRSKLVATGANGNAIQADHKRAMNSYNARRCQSSRLGFINSSSGKYQLYQTDDSFKNDNKRIFLPAL